MSSDRRVSTAYADINGGKLYYEVAGDDPVLVLAHAVIADQRMWDDQFPVFSQEYRVLPDGVQSVRAYRFVRWIRFNGYDKSLLGQNWLS